MRKPTVLQVLSLCTCLLLGPLAPGWAQGRPAGKILSVEGVTQVSPLTAAQFQDAVRNMPLHSGDTLRTGADGRASLLLADNSPAKLDVRTICQLLPPRGIPLFLRQGRYWGRPSHEMTPRTPAARILPRGTEIHVEVLADGTTTLTVLEGEARFENEQGSVLVREAQESTARPGQAPTPPVAAVNLPLILEWVNDVQPVALLLEERFVSGGPARLAAAQREAQALPPGPERQQRLGDVLHDRGELPAARAAYEAAQAQLGAGANAGARAAVAMRIGQTLLELGKVPEAEAAFRASLALDGGLTRARAGLVMTLLSRRQHEEAQVEARAAVAGEGGSALAHTVLALTQIRGGEREAAEQELAAALARDGEYAPAYAWRSFLLRASERLDEAETAARKAVELTPYSSLARQSLSDVAFAGGRVREAREEAERAVALNPLSPGAHVSLGRVWVQQHQLERAQREADQAVALDPDLERARFFRGVVLAERRRLPQAAGELEAAVKRDPGYVEAAAFLARVYLEQGRRGEADRVVRAAVERAPEFAPARAVLGRVYWRGGKLKEAEGEYREALRLRPKSGVYHLELARVELDANDLPGALSHAQAGVYLLPGSSEAHAVLGLVYDRQDNGEQAVREYLEAISLSPDNSLARLGLVTAFTPRSRDLLQSGRERLRERAQALLRDPSVLQQVFEPGRTSELSVGGGNQSHEEQQYLHRGQFAGGRLHDLSLASRFSDDGYRRNGAVDRRLLQTDVALQATPDTQILLQYQEDKRSGGRPESVTAPDPTNFESRRENDYELYVRHALGEATHLWLKYGIHARRESLSDPDAPAMRVEGINIRRPLSLVKTNRRNDEQIPELRLDHRIGHHILTYSLAYSRDNVLLSAEKYAPPGAGSGDPALVRENLDFLHDLSQYVQDDWRLGERGTLIAGARLLRTRERVVQRLSGTAVDAAEQEMLNDVEHDLFPYLSLTYQPGARDLIRLLGNEMRLRFGNPLLAPSEAFILAGEPVGIFHNGRLATYELDYEHRFSSRTFTKLFVQHSLARDYTVLPRLDQSRVSRILVIPTVQAQFAGVRFEHQIDRHLAGFLRLSYARVQDRTDTAYPVLPGGSTQENAARGLQVPLAPRWRGVLGLNYVDRSGTKVRLVATFMSRRFTDVGSVAMDTSGPPGIAPPGPPSGVQFADGGSRAPFGAPGFERSKRRASVGARTPIELRIAKEPTLSTEYSLTITNLFNTSDLDWPGFPAPGRTWLLSVAVRFK